MKKHTGFSLIEVLIAMIILAGGLLGLAGLQVTSLKNSQNAYYRSVATQLAYEIADRMRANYTAAKSGAYNYNSATDTAAQKSGCLLKATGCLPADMAQNDLFEWNQVLQSSLPDVSETITITNDGVVTVTTRWTENRYKNGQKVSGTTSFRTSFQL